MLTRCLIVSIGLIAALLICAGCAKKSMLDKNWGRSFKAAKHNQTLNPEAGENLDPVVGLDGQAAENSMAKYRESFKKQAPKEVYNLNIGGIGTK